MKFIKNIIKVENLSGVISCYFTTENKDVVIYSEMVKEDSSLSVTVKLRNKGESTLKYTKMLSENKDTVEAEVISFVTNMFSIL